MSTRFSTEARAEESSGLFALTVISSALESVGIAACLRAHSTDREPNTLRAERVLGPLRAFVGAMRIILTALAHRICLHPFRFEGACTLGRGVESRQRRMEYPQLSIGPGPGRIFARAVSGILHHRSSELVNNGSAASVAWRLSAIGAVDVVSEGFLLIAILATMLYLQTYSSCRSARVRRHQALHISSSVAVTRSAGDGMPLKRARTSCSGHRPYHRDQASQDRCTDVSSSKIFFRCLQSVTAISFHNIILSQSLRPFLELLVSKWTLGATGLLASRGSDVADAVPVLVLFAAGAYRALPGICGSTLRFSNFNSRVRP